MLAAGRATAGRMQRHAATLALAALTALAGALAAGCAALPAPPPNPAPPAAPSTAPLVLTGRLSVNIAADGATPARAMTAAFELEGDARQGRLDLATPIGTVLAQARWSPRQVVLATPQGQTPFADLDALTHEALGQSVPVAALFDWLQGRAWPLAPSRALAAGAGFEQLGWRVDLERFAADRLLSAERPQPAPATTVRIKLDSL